MAERRPESTYLPSERVTRSARGKHVGGRRCGGGFEQGTNVTEEGDMVGEKERGRHICDTFVPSGFGSRKQGLFKEPKGLVSTGRGGDRLG